MLPPRLRFVDLIFVDLNGDAWSLLGRGAKGYVYGEARSPISITMKADE
jgi:hypothetical protein